MAGHRINSQHKADFVVDGKYIFQIGGSGKDKKQIEGLDNSYIVFDDIEYGFLNRIPLYLSGFLW